MSPVFLLTVREVCNVVYALLADGLSRESREQFDADLVNPAGRETVEKLRTMGVA